MNEQGADPVWNDIKPASETLWKRIASKVQRKSWVDNAFGPFGPMDRDDGQPGDRELEDGDRRVIIMRGLPGSGKSTKAKTYGGTVVSADNFFMDGGEYKFNPQKIGEAHAQTQALFKEALERGDSPIVVDNTNTMGWESKPYEDMAKAAGYSVTFDEVGESTPSALLPAQLADRNQHGVPEVAIKRMQDRWEGELHNPSLQGFASLARNAAGPNQGDPLPSDISGDEFLITCDFCGKEGFEESMEFLRKQVGWEEKKYHSDRPDEDVPVYDSHWRCAECQAAGIDKPLDLSKEPPAL